MDSLLEGGGFDPSVRPCQDNRVARLYHCFSLSLRDVELILAARGIVVSYESIREWGLRFGRIFANTLKRRRPRPGDKWYIDEVFASSAPAARLRIPRRKRKNQVRNGLFAGGRWIRTSGSGASGEADAILPVKDRPR